MDLLLNNIEEIHFNLSCTIKTKSQLREYSFGEGERGG